MSSSCCSCFKEEILPYIDFLHPTTTYETKKITKCSILGTFLFTLFIATFIILFFIIYFESKKILQFLIIKISLEKGNLLEKK